MRKNRVPKLGSSHVLLSTGCVFLKEQDTSRCCGNYQPGSCHPLSKAKGEELKHRCSLDKCEIDQVGGLTERVLVEDTASAGNMKR